MGQTLIIPAPCIFVTRMIFNFFFCSYKLLNRCLPSLIIYTCSWCIPDWNIIPHNSQISRNRPIKKIWTSANSIYHHCVRDICQRDLIRKELYIGRWICQWSIPLSADTLYFHFNQAAEMMKMTKNVWKVSLEPWQLSSTFWFEHSFLGKYALWEKKCRNTKEGVLK